MCQIKRAIHTFGVNRGKYWCFVDANHRDLEGSASKVCVMKFLPENIMLMNDKHFEVHRKLRLWLAESWNLRAFR